MKETNTGGITDIDGRYTIQANLGQTLIVSYIGYRTKEVKVERTTRITYCCKKTMRCWTK